MDLRERQEPLTLNAPPPTLFHTQEKANIGTHIFLEVKMQFGVGGL